MENKRCKVKNVFIQSIINTYTDFAENTSIHGLKYSVKKKTSVMERLLWICIVLAGVVGSVFMLRLFLIRFTSNPTRTSIGTAYAPTIAIPFPGVTICNLKQILSSKVDDFISKLDLQNRNETSIRKIFPQLLAYTSPGYYNDTELQIFQTLLNINEYGSYESVVGKLGQRCRDMLVKCKWEAKIINCFDYFNDIYTERGICCSFNYNSNNKQILSTYFYGFQMGLSVLLNPMIDGIQYSDLNSDGLRVIIHYAKNEIGIGSTQKVIATGRESFLQLSGVRYKTTSDVRVLTPDARKCIYSDEFALKYFSEYSEENCKAEHRADQILNACNCVPFYYTFTDKPICNATKISCLERQRGIEPENATCPQICEEFDYKVLSTNTKLVNNNYSTSSFLSGTNITEKSILLRVFFSGRAQTILVRDTITSPIYLFSSFGGIFSLFLGCSFISAVEIIYYITIRFLFNYQELKANKMKINMVKPEKSFINKNLAYSKEQQAFVYTLYDNKVFLH